MDNCPIVFLHELKIKPEDLDGLEEDLKAAYCLSCYAVTEINTILRLYVGTCHDRTGHASIDFAIFSQQVMLLRVLSAKIFEFFEFILLHGKDNKTKSQKLKDLLAVQKGQINALLAGKDHDLVKYIRNDATNHYTLRAARMNMAHLSARADLSIYAHEETGNSFYPAGEELMFAGRLHRHSSEQVSAGESSAEFLDRWFEWNVKAIKHVHAAHLEISRWAIFRRLKHKAKKRIYFLKPALAGSMESRFPVFLLKHSSS